MVKPIEQQVTELSGKLSKIKAIEVPRAVASALNKTTSAARTRTVKGIAKAIGVPQKHVRKRVFFKKAKSNKMRSRLRAYYRGISLIDLKARDTGKGGWKTRRGSGVKAGRHHYRDAFIATGKNSKRHVFRRTGRSETRKRNGARGKSLEYRYDNVEVIRIDIRKQVDAIAPKAAKRELQQNFPKRLQRDLAWRLSKYEAK